MLNRWNFLKTGFYEGINIDEIWGHPTIDSGSNRDPLIVVDIIFRGDRKELDKFEQGVKNLNQQLNKVARGFAVAGAAP